MGMIHCRDCQRLRRYIELLRDRNGELELRLDGALQRERCAAAARGENSKPVPAREERSRPAASARQRRRGRISYNNEE